METERRTRLYGLLAEFDDSEKLLAAARRAREAGYEDMQAYTPFAIEGLTDFVRVRRKGWIPRIVLTGGIFGGLSGFMMQYYYLGIWYPLNVGGRPPFSWPSFIPITFELTILGAALFGAFGMLALNGLPRPFHPVFTAPRFRLASQSEFFLSIESTDENFSEQKTRDFLESLGPVSVSEIFDR